jgi:hypothetical protein
VGLYRPAVGLVDKVIGALARAKGPLKCPECGEKTGWVKRGEQVVRCEGCGFHGSVMEWAVKGKEDAEAAEADADSPPEDTKIVRRELGGGSVAWEVPPTGKGGGLLGFGIIWTGFIAVFTALWVPALIRGEVEGNMPDWVRGVFLVPFWVVGLVVSYFGLRFKYARHLVVVDLHEVVMVRSLFKRSKRRALERKSMRSVEKKEFYRQNYQPVHGIELKGADGKLRFGTTLTEEEKDWLVEDIRRTVWPDKRAEKNAAGGSREALRLGMRAGSSGRSFTVDLPPPGGAGQWVGAAIGLLVAGAFLAIGIFALKDAGFFRYLWLGFNGLFALGMIAGLIGMLRNVGVTIRVAADRSEIRVQRVKSRRVLSEKRMPREGVEVRSYISGRSNQTQYKRVELVGLERVLPIVRWRTERDVKPFVRELRERLG